MHVTPEQIVDWIDRRASSADCAQLEAHTADCERCAVQVTAVRDLIQTMTRDRTPEPPPYAVAAAIRALQSESLADAVGAWLGAAVARMAELVFDSLAVSPGTPAFAGARSAGTDRRLRFEGEGLELDLLVERHDPGRRLVGQLLRVGDEAAGPAPGCRFVITDAGSILARGETDAMGEFVADVPATAEFSIQVREGERAIAFHVTPPETH